MASASNMWQVSGSKNSSVNKVRLTGGDTFAVCATSGKRGDLYFGVIGNKELKVLDTRSSCIVGLDCYGSFGDLICVDQLGHVLQYDIRRSNRRACITPNEYGLPKGSKITATAMNSDGYRLAIASLPKSLANCRKRSGQLNKNSTNYDDDSDYSSSVILLDIRKMNEIMHSYSDFHSDAIQALQFSFDNPNMLLSGGADGLVNLINCSEANEEDALKWTQSVTSSIDCVGFLTGNRAYATTDDSSYAVFTVDDNNNIICRSKSRHFLVDLLDNSCTDSFLYLACSSEGKASIYSVFSNGKKTSLADLFDDHKDLIRCCCYDRSQNILLTGGDDGQIICKHLRQSLSKSNYSAVRVMKSKRQNRQKPY